MIGYIVMEAYQYEGLNNGEEPYRVYLKRADAEAKVASLEEADRKTGSRYHEIVEVELDA